SSALSPGEIRVIRSGIAGDMLVRFRLRFVDGVQVSKVRVAQAVLSSPVSELRMVGAAPVATVATANSIASTGSAPAVDGTGSGKRTRTGEATWYHAPSHGMTAASPWLPFGTHVTVTNLANGKSVTVVINDRGPFGGRVIDLSEEAFALIARPSQGVIRARLTW